MSSPDPVPSRKDVLLFALLWAARAAVVAGGLAGLLGSAARHEMLVAEREAERERNRVRWTDANRWDRD